MSFFRSLLLCVLLLALPCASAMASGGAKKAEGGAHGGGEKKAEGGAHGGGEKKPEAGGDEGSVTGGKFEGDPVYIHLKPLIFPIISDYGAEQIITMIIDMEAKDFDTATKLNAARPKLNDAIIRALYGGLADGSLRNAKVLDIPKIKEHIRKTLNETFGEGSIRDVLVQAVAQRKL